MTQTPPGVTQGKRQLNIPNVAPTTPAQEAENWRAVQAWAAQQEGSPYDSAFFDVVCDGTRSSYTFNVPNIYTHLWYILSASAASVQNLQVQFNGDTTAAHYNDVVIDYTYNGGSSGISSSNSFPRLLVCDGTNRPAIAYGLIANYHSSTVPKSVAINNALVTGVAFAIGYVGAGLWAENAPVTSMTLVMSGSTTIVAGSTLKVGGVW